MLFKVLLIILGPTVSVLGKYILSLCQESHLWLQKPHFRISGGGWVSLFVSDFLEQNRENAVSLKLVLKQNLKA